MLSTSTFQEWNGTTVTLWQVFPLNSVVSRFHFFHFHQCHGMLCIIMAWNSSFTTLTTSTLWVIPVTSLAAPARRMLQKLCRLGIHSNKIEGPSTCFTVLGIELDPVCLPQQGFQRFRNVHVGARTWSSLSLSCL